MKKLVIFDLDGTLLNTIADLAGATNYALKACGYPQHDTDEYRFFVGNGINKLFERALPEAERNETNIRKIRSLFVPYYNMHNADLSRPIRRYRMCSNASGKRNGPRRSLEQISGSHRKAHQALFPANPFPPRLRPAGECARQARPQRDSGNHAGCRSIPQDTAYIGDSGVDMQTGINAGTETIGAAWGFRPRTELEAYHPAFIADTPKNCLIF